MTRAELSNAAIANASALQELSDSSEDRFVKINRYACGDLAKMLRESARLLSEPEWRPISEGGYCTNGTHFMVCSPNNHQHIAYFDKHQKFNVYGWGDDISIHEWTHWQPLPPPPTPSTGATQ
jgi:hypothetical protein